MVRPGPFFLKSGWEIYTLSPCFYVAPRAGFEPATNRLTAGCSTTELPGNNAGAKATGPITKPKCFAKRESPTRLVEGLAAPKLRVKSARLRQGFGGQPSCGWLASRSAEGAKVGGHGRNRTGVHGFAVRCVTTPPRGQWEKRRRVGPSLYRSKSGTTITTGLAQADLGSLAFCAPLPHKSHAHRSFSRTAMIDFAAARRHMVDGQVRTADVTDLRIILAMPEIPRE